MSKPFIGNDTGIKWKPPKRRPKDKSDIVISLDPSVSSVGVAVWRGDLGPLKANQYGSTSMSILDVGQWLRVMFLFGTPIILAVEDAPPTGFFKIVHSIIEEIVSFSKRVAKGCECELLICRVMPGRWRSDIGIPKPPSALGWELSATKRRHVRRKWLKDNAIFRAKADYPDIEIGKDDDKAEALCILTWALKEFEIRGLL